MAKVVVEYDTKEKTTVIKVDGEEQVDVDHISFNYYQNFDGQMEGHMEMVKSSRDKDNDTVTVTRVHAEEPRTPREKLLAGVAKYFQEK